jgi:hypothetical protein
MVAQRRGGLKKKRQSIRKIEHLGDPNPNLIQTTMNEWRIEWDENA